MRNALIYITFGCLLCSYSYADDDYSGFYIGAGAGASKVDVLPNVGYAIEVNAGYNFDRYYAFELQANMMPSTQWSNNLLNSYNVFSGAAKGILPLSNEFDLYGKLGLGLGMSYWSGQTLINTNSTYDCKTNIYTCSGNATGAIGLGTIGANFKLTDDFSIFVENNNFIPLGGGAGSFGYTYNGIVGVQYDFGARSAAKPTQVNCEADPLLPGCNMIVELKASTIAEQENFDKRVITLRNGDKYIVVNEGDTLLQVSKFSEAPIEYIRLINKLKDNKIVIGERLYLYKPNSPINDMQGYNNDVISEVINQGKNQSKYSTDN